MSDSDSSGKEQPLSARRLWPLFVGLPLLAAIAIGALLLSGGEEQRSVRPAGEGRHLAAGEEASRGGDLAHPSLGSRNAPVVMIEYSDYQ